MFLSIYKKILSSQILNYFFGEQTIKFNYGHGARLFGQSILGFRFLDIFFVHFSKSQNTLPKNS